MTEHRHRYVGSLGSPTRRCVVPGCYDAESFYKRYEDVVVVTLHEIESSVGPWALAARDILEEVNWPDTQMFIINAYDRGYSAMDAAMSAVFGSQILDEDLAVGKQAELTKKYGYHETTQD